MVMGYRVVVIPPLPIGIFDTSIKRDVAPKQHYCSAYVLLVYGQPRGSTTVVYKMKRCAHIVVNTLKTTTICFMDALR